MATATRTTRKFAPVFGVVLDALPEAKTSTPTDPAPWWSEVAAKAGEHPGKWVEVERMEGMNLDRLRTVPGEIRKGKLLAFRDHQYDAAMRDGKLYVRLVSIAKPGVVLTAVPRAAKGA